MVGGENITGSLKVIMYCCCCCCFYRELVGVGVGIYNEIHHDETALGSVQILLCIFTHRYLKYQVVCVCVCVCVKNRMAMIICLETSISIQLHCICTNVSQL